MIPLASTMGDACRILVELSPTLNIGSEIVLTAPSRGPEIVEIAIKGVPVVAHISNNSRYTTISASVAKTFNLKRLEKTSLVGIQGRADALLGHLFSERQSSWHVAVKDSTRPATKL
jgi:hypothetical protein